jgi:hypothetical protein
MNVWGHMTNVCRSNDCWFYIKPAQCSKDGRQGFMLIFQDYLGLNNATLMSNVAEALLDAATYTAERRNWDFEKFVMVHTKQHSVLAGLMEFGHAGINEASCWESNPGPREGGTRDREKNCRSYDLQSVKGK